MAVYDTWADREVGHLVVELRTGRCTGEPWRVLTVAESAAPVTTMGGLGAVPDVTLAEVTPADADLLVLAGNATWDEGGGAAFVEAAAAFLAAGVPVAAICGATAGLARAGLLDGRRHTSAAPEYLAATGYGGGEHDVSERRAVADDGLVTAGPASPVQFARVTLEHLRLAQ